MDNFYTQSEISAALRAAACRLAACLPELTDAAMAFRETCYTEAGAVIVEYVPRAAVKFAADEPMAPAAMNGTTNNAARSTVDDEVDTDLELTSLADTQLEREHEHKHAGGVAVASPTTTTTATNTAAPAHSRVMTFAQFAAEIERRKRSVGLLSDAQRSDVIEHTIAHLPAERSRLRVNPTEKAILRVCSKDTPLKGLVICRRIGREYDSYLRSTLASMVRRGLLRRSAQVAGYVLA